MTPHVSAPDHATLTDDQLHAVVASGRVDLFPRLTVDERRRLAAWLEQLGARHPDLPSLLIMNDYDTAAQRAGLDAERLRNVVRAIWPGWTPRPPAIVAGTIH